MNEDEIRKKEIKQTIIKNGFIAWSNINLEICKIQNAIHEIQINQSKIQLAFLYAKED